jgi:hypothetical protein
MKSFGQFAEEIAVVNKKQNKRSLLREKDMYTFWRNKKLRAIEGARRCKKCGWSDLQLRYQHEAAKYDKWAKESKARIQEIGKWIYK